MRSTLRLMLDDRVRWLRGRGYLKSAFERVSRKQLIQLGSELRYNAELSIEEERGPIYQAMMWQSSALTLFHMLELLETQGPYTLKAFMDRMEKDGKRSHSALMREDMYGTLSKLLNNESLDHPKVDMLREVVGDQLAVNPGSRMLVFTQYRDTATHLVEELKRMDGVKAERFVGQATRLGDEGLTQEQQASLIGDLRKGYLNTLVATSIAEEGLDIPEVDLVVFYEPIPSEIRYIQRRGRTGRRTAGRAIILATNDTYDMIYLYASSRRVERMASIASKLNTMLRPVLRLRPRPVARPMTQEELAEIQRVTGLVAEPQLLVTEGERLRDLGREVARAERALYFKILERGVIGLRDEELYEEMVEEGFSKGVVKAAMSRLVKGTYVAAEAGRSAIPVKAIPGTRLMDIEVEKVLTGLAVVWVDDRWRARLSPEDYEGPRDLMRKGARFRALCRLYHDSGVLCVRVRQVMQAERRR